VTPVDEFNTWMQGVCALAIWVFVILMWWKQRQHSWDLKVKDIPEDVTLIRFVSVW